MPVITLPDGSRREFPKPVTVAEVAVGLALVILLYQRRRTAEPDQATLLRG